MTQKNEKTCPPEDVVENTDDGFAEDSFEETPESQLESHSSSRARLITKKISQRFLDAVHTIALERSLTERDTFALRNINPLKIIIAYSGGRDSTALLNVAAWAFKRRYQTEIASITAVHVHHGISENADSWAEHCQQFAQSLGIDFRLEKVFISKASPSGIEASAREARYRALYAAADELGADAIFTAHHMDDQLETFLIQWMRGTGIEGLSGIPVSRLIQNQKKTSVSLCRPWLDITREEINTYIEAKKLCYVEDESNSDSHYVRNLIRNEVFPLLEKARLGWKNSAFRTMNNIALASSVLKNVAKDDCESCEDAKKKALSIQKLRELSPERQALTLRFWLNKAGIRSPNKARLEETLTQIRETSTDTKLTIRFGGKEMRRWGDRLVLIDSTFKNNFADLDVTIHWNGEESIEVPIWQGKLRFETCIENEEGFDAELLRSGTIYLRARRGGEKLKLHSLRPSRNLKHLYQEAQIPTFEREKLPLIWLDKELIYVAGLGSEIRLLADADLIHNRVRLVWIPNKSLLD